MTATSRSKFAWLLAGALVAVVPVAAAPNAHAAPIGWTVQFGSSGDDFVTGVATNSKGEVVATGYTDDDVAAVNGGYYEPFLIKFDKNGNELWRRQWGGVDHVLAFDVAMASNGDIYVVGDATGNFDSQTSNGQDDAFLTKFDKNGTRLWTKLLGSTQAEAAYDVAVQGSSIFISGVTSGTVGAQNFGGLQDAFVAKYDKTGARLWVTQVGTAGNEAGFQGITVSSNGKDVYAVGTTSAYFGSTPDNDGNGADVFVAKFAGKTGALVWTSQMFGDAGSNFESGMAIALSGTKLYVTGGTNGTYAPATLNGVNDAYLAIFPTSGAAPTVFQFGTSGNEEGNGLALTSSGEPVVAASTSGAFPGFANAGGSDLALRRFTKAGVPIATRQIGSSTNDSDQGDGTVGSLAAGKSGSVILAGSNNSPVFGQDYHGSADGFITVVPKITA